MNLSFLHLRNYVLNVCVKYFVALKRYADTLIDRIEKTTITFTYGSVSVPVTLKNNEIVIETTIIPDKHTHNNLTGTVPGIPKTVPQRDSSGNLFSGGKSFIETGYRLANGIDIGELFDKVTNYTINGVQYIDSGVGNRLVNATFSINNTTKIININRSFANDCSYSYNCYCHCCC